ncbi:MAG: hypothetical protein R2814_16505 [Flavobacteriaceae bacterium]
MSIQLEKRGFYLNVYDQDTKNPRFPALFFILFARRAVRCLYARFLEGDLGKIYLAVPWDDPVGAFRLARPKRLLPPFSPQGQAGPDVPEELLWPFRPQAHRAPEREPGLAVLCGIYLGTGRLSNFKMVGEVRYELAGKLDMDGAQEAFYSYWSPYIGDSGSITMDAHLLREPSAVPYQHQAAVGGGGLDP